MRRMRRAVSHPDINKSPRPRCFTCERATQRPSLETCVRNKWKVVLSVSFRALRETDRKEREGVCVCVCECVCVCVFECVNVCVCVY